MDVCQCHSIYLTGTRKTIRNPTYKSENDLLVYTVIYSHPPAGRECWGEGGICLQWSIFLNWLTSFFSILHRTYSPCFCPCCQCKKMMQFVPYCGPLDPFIWNVYVTFWWKVKPFGGSMGGRIKMFWKKKMSSLRQCNVYQLDIFPC